MSRQARTWSGVEAADASIDQVRGWVIWGAGAAPPVSLQLAEPGDDIAEGIARGEGWTGDGWIVVLYGEESDIDGMVDAEPRAAGYTAYLVDGMPGADRVGQRPSMRGVLRDDVAPRRKAEPR